MKDDYKRLSNEWGSKARKEEARERKSRLRAETRALARDGEMEAKEDVAPTPSEDYGNKDAPPGKVYQCQACGKLSRDLYGDKRISRGWDESCVLNCALVDEGEVNK